MTASTRTPAQSPAASHTGRLAPLGPPVVLKAVALKAVVPKALQHARQLVIPASAVATAGATFHLVEDHTTQMQRSKL